MLVAWVLVGDGVATEVLRDIANACWFAGGVELRTDWGREDGVAWCWDELLAGLGGAERVACFGDGGATEEQMLAWGSGAAWGGDAAWSWSFCT